MNRSVIIVFYGLLAGYFVSCGGLQAPVLTDLMQTQYSITDSAPLFCSEDIHNFYENKILFVIDKTSSNKKSDPEGLVRLEGVKSFIQQNKDSGSFYSFIGFSDQIFSPLHIYNIPSFTINPQTIDEALQKISDRKDKGRGDYFQLLDKIEKTIEYDVRRTRNKVVEYHVVFISDGSLSHLSKEQERDFVQGLKKINSKFRNLQIHSIYYGEYKDRPEGIGRQLEKVAGVAFNIWFFSSSGFSPYYYGVGRYGRRSNEADFKGKETEDVAYLQNLSEKGNYVDFNEDSSLNFNLDQKWNSSPFVIYNVNSSVCFNGDLGLDSDSDGLCDEDEERLEGFQPDNRFSFGDGYGDSFHWFALSQRQALPPCANNKDEDHDLLTYCEEEYINSIESDYLHLSAHNPDSDEDGIIDGIEVLVYWKDNPLASRDPNNVERMSEGLRDYDRIVNHISPFSSIDDQIRYENSLMPVTEKGSTCYSIQQNEVPLYSSLEVSQESALGHLSHVEGENIFLIYSLKERVKGSSRVYQFMRHPISKKGLNAFVGDQSFHYFSFQSSFSRSF